MGDGECVCALVVLQTFVVVEYVVRLVVFLQNLAGRLARLCRDAAHVQDSHLCRLEYDGTSICGISAVATNRKCSCVSHCVCNWLVFVGNYCCNCN